MRALFALSVILTVTVVRADDGDEIEIAKAKAAASLRLATAREVAPCNSGECAPATKKAAALLNAAPSVPSAVIVHTPGCRYINGQWYCPNGKAIQ